METHPKSSRLTYFLVYLALLALLGITLLAGRINLGSFNLVAALAIASVKAFLVIWFFMHVREGSQLTRIFVIAGFVWLSILVGLTLTDYLSRSSDFLFP